MSQLNEPRPIPSTIQVAMATKDKKPFTYLPGGLNLNEIRSPRMQRRLERNAQTPPSPEQVPQKCLDYQPQMPAPPPPQMPSPQPNNYEQKSPVCNVRSAAADRVCLLPQVQHQPQLNKAPTPWMQKPAQVQPTPAPWAQNRREYVDQVISFVFFAHLWRVDFVESIIFRRLHNNSYLNILLKNSENEKERTSCHRTALFKSVASLTTSHSPLISVKRTPRRFIRIRYV